MSERSSEGESSPSAAPPSLADALAPTSLKPSWMAGASSTLGALAKPPPSKKEDGGLAREEVTSFGICDRRYGYKSRNGYGHRSFEKRSGKRNTRDRDRDRRDHAKEQWDRGMTHHGDKDRPGREQSGRRDRERGKDRERGRDNANRKQSKPKRTDTQRSSHTAHSVSPRMADGSEREAITRRGSLPSSEISGTNHNSPRATDSDPALERARALVPSQPLVPKKGGKSRQREKRDTSKKKRAPDHYYPNRPPPIKIDPASLQPLAQLTSPRYHGSAASPRSHSPSPSPRGAAVVEENKVPVRQRERTSFFESLRERDQKTSSGGRYQLSMRSADDLLMAGKPNNAARWVFKNSPISMPRGAMAKGSVGSPHGSPASRKSSRATSNDSVASMRMINSSDSDRVLISEDDEEEEQRFLKEMGWKKDDVADDDDDWQLTEEEIESTRKEMVDKNVSLEANLPLSRMQYFQNFQKTMPGSAATASSPALLRFSTAQAHAKTDATAEEGSP